jgi:predicted acylesterase/phospholipase RssA
MRLRTNLLAFMFLFGVIHGFASNGNAKEGSRFHAEKKQAFHVRFLDKARFRHYAHARVAERETVKAQKKKDKYNITTLSELNDYWDDKEHHFRRGNGEIDYTALIRQVNVSGDSQQRIGTADYTHPVAQILHERKRTGNKTDGCKVALAIEGGGMRGCVSAGMAAAIGYLNLTDSFDVVYGSSAGTVIGSYLITNQVPWFGPELYYDCLPTAGRQFIDSRRLLRAIGLGGLDPRLLRDVVTRRGGGKPVLDLTFLLKRCLQQLKPLDWDTFVEKQKTIPLNVIASGCRSEKAIALNMENGGFSSLHELSEAMHGSCLLPGLAGPLINLDKRAMNGESVATKFVHGNHRISSDSYEPLVDALLYEPLPYRTAVAEGATHVLVSRTRPDGVDVTGKGGLFETLIFRRYFLRKNRLPRIFNRLRKQLHKKVYAEDVIRLNEEANSQRNYKDTTKPHLLGMAMPPGSPEISRLETDREAIFKGIRRGFARAYDCLVEDPAERGRGAEVAAVVFPDEILDYDPLSLSGAAQESAFSIYLRQSGITPKAWANNNPYAAQLRHISSC